MSSPLVTVITPTFNRAYILPTAIKSVLDQTYKNFEYIIVDDGSTDNTEEVVGKINDKRIIYIKNNRSKGPSGARNTGLDIAKGEWVTYIDDDDQWYPKLLEVMIRNVIKNKKTVFAIPRGKKTLELYENNVLVKEIDNSDNYPKNLSIQDIVFKTFHFDNIGFMHSRKVIDDTIRFDETGELGALEDWEFALQLCEKYPNGLLKVSDTLFHYRQRYGTDGRVSNDTYKKTILAYEYVFQKHKNDKILEGQTWYPQRVEKYKKLQKDFEKGNVPPKYLLPFQNQ
jgi:glycosyltransferase involved in cell wall biosynthesis